ncbi:hypothetical protein Tco_0838083 [Tanacetum coccineum]|uniref:Uncharacterized protein n=1 Tax=Tanacetum coccineum TaxID=301880 RepID=A0ABQ5ALT2_9ASTR
MSNKTQMTQEHLTAEAMLDEERATNGRIYQDWYDLEAQEPNTHRKRRTNVNSCPTQIIPVPFTEAAMGIKAPSIAKSHPQRSTMSPIENVPNRTTEDHNTKMWKGDRSTSLSGFGILKTWKW